MWPSSSYGIGFTKLFFFSLEHFVEELLVEQG